MIAKNKQSGAVVCPIGPTKTQTSQTNQTGGTGATTAWRTNNQSGVWTERTNFFDLGSQTLPDHLKALLPAPEELPDDKMIVYGFIARAECVYTYFARDGSTTRLYRPGSAVYEQASLDSLFTCSFTNDHPREGDGSVTGENWQDLSHGIALEAAIPFPEHGLVAGKFLLSTAAIIKAWKGGKKYLSTGERSREVATPDGDLNGQPYDRMVVEIVYNHVALVDAPRGGPLIQLRENKLPYPTQPNSNPKQEIPMETVVIVVGGREFTVPKNEEEAWRSRLNSLFVAVPAETETVLATAQQQVSQLQAQNDELTAQNEELRTNSATPPTPAVPALTEEEVTVRVNAAATIRLNALTKALPLLADKTSMVDGKLTVVRKNSKDETVSFDLASLDPAGLYREAILARRPSEATRLNGRDASYLEARVDMLLEHAKISELSVNILDKASNNARLNSRADGGDGDASEAEKKRDAAREERQKKMGLR